MPLKLRPTGLGHGVYKDIPDYGVFCGEWCIGRIYKTRTVPELRWFWALHAPSKPGTCGPRTSGDADEAKAEFEAWVGDGRVGSQPLRRPCRRQPIP